jgi:hypothetical protein
MTDTASGLWDRLCAMPRPHKIITFPRRKSDGALIDDQIAMWVLTQGEQEEAAARAEQRARDLLKSPKESSHLSTADIRASDVYRNAAADELLYRACRDPKNLKAPFIPSPAHLRQFLSVDEVAVLCQIYYGVQDDLGPLVSTMTDDEREALLKQLEKDGARFPLGSLSREQVNELLIFSVCRRSTLSTDMSLPGKPQDESTSEPSTASDSDEGPDAPSSD